MFTNQYPFNPHESERPEAQLEYVEVLAIGKVDLHIPYIHTFRHIFLQGHRIAKHPITLEVPHRTKLLYTLTYHHYPFQ
jgi:hypothetical protein